MTKTFRPMLLGLVCAGLLAGCGARGVQIADLKDRPGRYDDRTISITGVVTNSWGLPMLPVQLYHIDDGTGEIAVLSRSGRPPVRGTRVEVRGRVNEFAVLGGRSFGLHIQEHDRRVRRS